MRSTLRDPTTGTLWQLASGYVDGSGARQQTPHLVTNPADDEVFRHFAHEVLSGDTRLTDFRASLRARYPAAVVNERMLSGEPWLVWYCYRDGSWVGRGRRRGEDG
jgi:hypothetical protein